MATRPSMTEVPPTDERRFRNGWCEMVQCFDKHNTISDMYVTKVCVTTIIHMCVCNVSLIMVVLSINMVPMYGVMIARIFIPFLPVICVMAPPIHLGAWSMAMAAFCILPVVQYF